MADLLPITLNGRYVAETKYYYVAQRIYWDGWKQHLKNRYTIKRLLTLKKH